MEHDPDFALIRRCQSRDDQTANAAFEELFDLYRDRVYNLSHRLLGDAAEAEDVTQETFVTVFRKIGAFRFSSRFYTWLYRVVYNLCVDYRRRAAMGSAAAALVTDSDVSLAAFSDPEKSPLEELAEGEHRKRTVEAALGRLSRPLRAVVLLRYMEDLPYSEIAEVLGCSVGTVKSRLSRAHQFLQQVLEGKGDG
jgi:RNA polymerase sigma-70 factor (ECF subfamily)